MEAVSRNMRAARDSLFLGDPSLHLASSWS